MKQENRKEADRLGKHWEKGGANEDDAGQIWRESVEGKAEKTQDEKPKAAENHKTRKHNPLHN